MKRAIEFVDVDEAYGRLVASTIGQPNPERVPVTGAAGQVLAEAVYAKRSLPPGDASHVDGYAVRAADTLAASETLPIRLRIVGRAGPGEQPSGRLKHGQAYRVLTGGFLPLGADTMVPQENARLGHERIELTRPAVRGQFVVPVGSDFAERALILPRGHRLRAVDLAPLTTLGVFHVRVWPVPQTMILSVGSELTNEPLGVRRGRVFIGHAYAVAELVRAAGGHPTVSQPIPDERGAIQRGLASAARQAALILTIGGSSVSEIDLVDAALRRVTGAELIAHGLKVQPGRVCGLGHVRGVPIVLLPGLIQSTVNAFAFIALPLLRRLQGLPETRYAGQVRARLTDQLVFRRFLSFRKVTWARLSRRGQALWATPMLGDSSHHHVLMASQGYVTTPEGVEQVAAGTTVDVNLVPGISRLEDLP